MHNSHKLTIVIFGDSNTFGYKPNSYNIKTGKSQRFDETIRWSSLIQQKFPNVYFIEAGLNGRTTNINDPDWPNRSGLMYLPIVLEQAAPIDVLIIALGTNDLKSKYCQSPKDIEKNIIGLIQKAQQISFIENAKPIKIILLTPPKITKEDSFGPEFFGAIEKNNQLPEIYKSIAHKHGVIYADCSNIEPDYTDGIHLNPEGHQKVAALLTPIIEKLITNR